MTRNLGEMAEAELKKWAAQVNITANPSTSDREGWDFILQFPHTIVSDKPLDLQPLRIECFIQVKGGGTNKRRQSIEISNWMRLVNTFLPAFFLIINYGSEIEPQDAYLVHVDEKIMSKVIKRLRSIQTSDVTSLNKMTMDLSWHQEDRLDSLDGKGLQAAIRRQIGENFSTYVLKKEKLRNEIGMDAPLILQITSEPRENFDDLMEELGDFAIGIRDELSVSKIVMEENVRFGIPANKIEEGKGFLSIINRPQTGKPVKVILSNKTENLQSSFDGVLYTPDFMFPGHLDPKKYQKVRIETAIADFIIDILNHKYSISLKISKGTDLKKLSELVNFWRVIKILEVSKKEGGFVEITDGINSPLRFKLTGVGTIPKVYFLVSQAIDNTWFLARYFDLPADMLISLEDVVNNNRLLSEVCRLCNPISSIGISFGLDGELELISGETYALVLGKNIKLGEKILGVIIGLAGCISDNSIEQGMYQMKFPRMVHLEHYITLEMDDEKLKRYIQKAEEILVEKGLTVIPNHDNEI